MKKATVCDELRFFADAATKSIPVPSAPLVLHGAFTVGTAQIGNGQHQLRQVQASPPELTHVNGRKLWRRVSTSPVAIGTGE
jgi:hypothetical protein